MKSKIISIDLFKKADRWNLELFLKSTVKLKKSKHYKSIKLKDILSERKEFLVPLDFKDTVFNYIGLENITQNTRNISNFTPKFGNEIKSRCKIFRNGDLLYGRLRPKLNKSLLIDNILNEGICSTEIFVLTINEENKNKIIPEYIIELFISPIILKEVSSITVGASLPRMQIKDFLNLEVPIPNLAVQHKLAEKAKNYRKLSSEYIDLSNKINKNLSNSMIENIECPDDFILTIDEKLEHEIYINPLPEGKFHVKGRNIN